MPRTEQRHGLGPLGSAEAPGAPRGDPAAAPGAVVGQAPAQLRPQADRGDQPGHRAGASRLHARHQGRPAGVLGAEFSAAAAGRARRRSWRRPAGCSWSPTTPRSSCACSPSCPATRPCAPSSPRAATCTAPQRRRSPASRSSRSPTSSARPRKAIVFGTIYGSRRQGHPRDGLGQLRCGPDARAGRSRARGVPEPLSRRARVPAPPGRPRRGRRRGAQHPRPAAQGRMGGRPAQVHAGRELPDPSERHRRDAGRHGQGRPGAARRHGAPGAR